MPDMASFPLPTIIFPSGVFINKVPMVLTRSATKKSVPRAINAIVKEAAMADLEVRFDLWILPSSTSWTLDGREAPCFGLLDRRMVG